MVVSEIPNHSISVKPSETIADVKAKLKSKTGISASQQRLSFEGRPLEDHRSLGDYKIKNQSTIHLQIGRPGDMPIYIEFGPGIKEGKFNAFC